MSIRFGRVRVSNVGLTILGNAGVYSNGLIVCNRVACNNITIANAVVANSITCNSVTVSNVLMANQVQCNALMTYNVTASNVAASNVTCTLLNASNALCTTVTCSTITAQGAILPNCASFTGEYRELDDVPIAPYGVYSNNTVTNNMKIYAATGAAGTGGKVTFYATTDGTATGPAMFKTIASIQLTAYYPSALTYSAVVTCVTSVSTDNRTIVGIGTTNGLAVASGTRFYVLVHGT